MEFSTRGNEKLGKCAIVSRAVGPSCPSSCYYLGNGCYAEFTEARFPAAKALGLRNMKNVEVGKIVRMIEWAIKNTGGKLRIHERGDFAKNDRLDEDYVSAWENALEIVKQKYGSVENVWCYTHLYDERLANLAKLGVKIYASVHNAKQMNEAKKAGFKLFAYILKVKRKRGENLDVPTTMMFNRQKFVVCPEQRKGRDKVTCCGAKNEDGSKSVACGLCVRGFGNVVFLDHSQMAKKSG